MSTLTTIAQTLSLMAMAMPLMALISERFRLRTNRYYQLLLYFYALMAVNSLLFIKFEMAFYPWNTLIDAQIFILCATIFALQNITIASQRRRILIATMVLCTIALITLTIAALQQVSVQPWAAAFALVLAIAAVIAMLKIDRRSKRPLVAVTLVAWAGGHAALIMNIAWLHDVMQSVFWILLVYLVFYHINRFHRNIFQANQFLVKTRETIIGLLQQISSSVEDITSNERTLRSVLDTILQTLRIDGAAFFIVDDQIAEKPVLRFLMAAGTIHPFENNTPLTATTACELGKGIVGSVAGNQKALTLDADTKPELKAAYPLNPQTTRNLLAVPVRMRNNTMGVIVVQNLNTPCYSAEDLYFVQSIADQAASFLHTIKLYEELATIDRMRQEMRIATEIQMGLLPKNVPTVKNMTIAARICPAPRASGNYYNFINNPNGTLGIAIGDINGKGIPASMMVVIAHTALEMIAKKHTDPREAIAEFSREMYAHMNAGQFMTMAYLLWHSSTRILTYSGAGFDSLIWYRSGSGSLERLKTGGMAIGLMPDPSTHIVNHEILAVPGDMLLLYTKGLVEVQNTRREVFGTQRLEQVALELCASADVKKVSDGLFSAIAEFSGNAEIADDQTLIVLAVTN